MGEYCVMPTDLFKNLTELNYKLNLTEQYLRQLEAF